MVWFKNTNRRKSVKFVYQGRKYSIPPNGKVQGPEFFSVYKDLIRISDQEANSPVGQTNFKVDKPNPILKNKAKSFNNKRHSVINNNIRTPVSVANLQKESQILQVNTSNLKEIDKAIQFSNNYPKNGLPSVGICILTKDSYELISDCLSSIEQHVKYPNYKIYIFDTGTKDPKVLNYYKTIKAEIINIGEYNFSRNYNDGIKKIDTDFAFIQNNDTLAINDYISKLMKISIVDKVGLSGPRMLYKNNTIQHDGQQLFSHGGTKFANPGHINIGAPDSSVLEELKEVDGITAAGVLIKKEWFDLIKGFDTSFKDIYQDVHLCIKNRMYGKYAYCDRRSKIYHYDNTSRKKLWNDTNKVKDMRLDHNNLVNQIMKGDLKLRVNEIKDFSIITLCNNNDQYHEFLESLKTQKTSATFEIICLPNYNNEYQSCSEALNIGLELSHSKYQILCHQDLVVPNNWIENILKHINELNQQKTNWGVLGMAGSWSDDDSPGDAVIYLHNDR